jgi:hypothetical protein
LLVGVPDGLHLLADGFGGRAGVQPGNLRARRRRLQGTLHLRGRDLRADLRGLRGRIADRSLARLREGSSGGSGGGTLEPRGSGGGMLRRVPPRREGGDAPGDDID